MRPELVKRSERNGHHGERAHPFAALARQNRRRRQEDRAYRLAQLTKQAVSHAWHVPEDELKAATRRRADVAAARQIAMYLCHVVFGLSFAEVGRQFLRDRTTVAYACECIEDRRDDRQFDLLLDRIELAVRAFSALGETGTWPGTPPARGPLDGNEKEDHLDA